MKKFSALYYPYASIRNLETLKKLMLYFDEIHIINPWMAFSEQSRNRKTGGDISEKIDNFKRELNPLHDQGILKFVDPAKIVDKYDSLITHSVIQDLSDENFVDLCRDHSRENWELCAVKLPHRSDTKFRNLLVNLSSLVETTSPSYHTSERRIEEIPYIRERVREGPYPYSEEKMRELHSRHVELDERKLHRLQVYNEYRMVSLPFSIGESIMISHALCSSYEYNLTPFTDEAIHHEILKTRYSRVSNNDFLKKILADYGYIKDTKTNLAAINIINETLPSFENIPFQNVLDFRDDHKEDLSRFKTHLGILTGKLESNIWDNDFEANIRDIVDQEITPSIQDIKDAFQALKEEGLVSVFKKGAKIVPIPLVVTAFVGMPLWLSLVLSVDIMALGGYLDYWQKKRDKMRNGVGYLFALQEFGEKRSRNLNVKRS